MKIFNWISRKTNRKQPELSKDTAAGADHSQEQQQQLHSHNPTLQASLFHQADAEFKFIRNKPAFSFSDAVVVKEDMQKKREILKIFLKHEEYGLLAIGTFGYGTSSDIEPEIELFEVKPSALEGVKDADQEQSSTTNRTPQATTTEQVEKEHAVTVLRKDRAKDNEKRLLPLDGFPKSHMPQIAGLFKGSKLADRILHPLNYLNSRNLKTVPGKVAEDFCHDMNKKKQMSSLFKMLLKRQNSSSMRALEPKKETTCDHSDGSSKKKVHGRLKKAISQFSCVSVDVAPDDDETVGGGIPTQSREDTHQEGPKQDYQETFVKDMNQEYWIRTDSDYVVLEL